MMFPDCHQPAPFRHRGAWRKAPGRPSRGSSMLAPLSSARPIWISLPSGLSAFARPMVSPEMPLTIASYPAVRVPARPWRLRRALSPLPLATMLPVPDVYGSLQQYCWHQAHPWAHQQHGRGGRRNRQEPGEPVGFRIDDGRRHGGAAIDRRLRSGRSVLKA